MKTNTRNYKGYVIYKDFKYGCSYYKVSGKDKSFCTLKECKNYIDTLQEVNSMKVYKKNVIIET